MAVLTVYRKEPVMDCSMDLMMAAPTGLMMAAEMALAMEHLTALTMAADSVEQTDSQKADRKALTMEYWTGLSMD